MSHSDIKAANIFLYLDNKSLKDVKLTSARDLISQRFKLVLGDFGLVSIYTHEKQYQFKQKGTPYYYAPELWEQKKYNQECDIWAMG